MRIVSKSSRRGTGISVAATAGRLTLRYASPLLFDSFRKAMSRTVEKPPHTKAMITSMVSQVDVLMDASLPSRRPHGRCLQRR